MKDSSDPVTVDELIATLRERKRTDPQFGKRLVWAGDTNLIAVEAITVSSRGDVILTDRDHA